MTLYFDHEKLKIYQASIRFVVLADELLSRPLGKGAVLDQLDRASTSIPLNIAEGNGKSSSRDRCRFFEIARGSALECATCLDVLVAKRRIEESEIAAGKELLSEIVKMLVGLMKSVSDRFQEEPAAYRAGTEQD